jgi:hypothetical protein
MIGLVTQQAIAAAAAVPGTELREPRVTVVTVQTDMPGAAPGSSLAEHGGTAVVQVIDMAGAASPGLAAQLGARAPSRLPFQSPGVSPFPLSGGAQ